jgi:hypothetical protein
MNIEHRTLNVQHRILYSVNFKNADQSEFTLGDSTRLSSSQAAVRLF